MPLCEIDKRIGANLRRCRKAAGFTQQQLADFAALVGYSTSQVRIVRIESGEARLSAFELVIFLKYLGVEASDLLG